MRFSVQFAGKVNEVLVEAQTPDIALNTAIHGIQVTNLDAEEVWKVVDAFKLEKVNP
jgi:hypothetical protein